MAEILCATVGEIRMPYAKFGQGRNILVFLPGLSIKNVSGLGDAVEAQYRVLSDLYTIYLFDRRQHPPVGYSIADMAEDTFSVMRSLGIGKADIFGVSQGGMMALSLSIRHPEAVGKMILASTSPCDGGQFQTVSRSWGELARKKDLRGLAESFADHLFGEATLKAYREQMIASNLDATGEDLERFVILNEAFRGFDLTENLSGIKAPTLVIGCLGDRVLGADASRQIADAIGCDCFLYGDAYGHAVYDEAPDYPVRMRKFLESIALFSKSP